MNRGKGLLDAQLLECREHHLGIGVTTEAMAARLENLPQLSEVACLAVEGDGDPPGHRGHRLMPFGREILDGEAAKAESDSGRCIDPRGLVIWT